MIIMHNRYKSWLGILAAIFLGVTFIVAAVSKLFTPVIESQLQNLPEAIPFYPVEVLLAWLVFAELVAGTFLIVGVYAKCAASLALYLVVGFIVSNILMITLGQEECLSCFGAMGKLSATQALYLDGLMMVLAVMILLYYPGRFFSIRPWYWGK